MTNHDYAILGAQLMATILQGFAANPHNALSNEVDQEYLVERAESIVKQIFFVWDITGGD